MRKLWIGVLLGAGVGAAVKVALELRGERPLDEVGSSVAMAAGEAAMAGAAVGFLLDRRDRRRRSRLQRMRGKANLGGMVAGASALADAARPVLHATATKAAAAAQPRIHAMSEAAKPRLHAAGEAAKAKLADLDLPVLVAV